MSRWLLVMALAGAWSVETAAEAAETVARGPDRQRADMLLAAYVFVHGGSGVVVSPEGWVLTNDHVIRGEDRQKLEDRLIDAELRGVQARLAEHGMAKELRESYSGESTSSRHSALKWWAVIAVALLIAVLARGSGVKAIAATVFGVLLLTRLPRGVWLKLGQKARIRDRD